MRNGLGMKAILLCIGALLFASSLVLAQQPSGAPAALSAGDSSHIRYTDVFTGRNTRGPYLLSWKGVRARSERVVVDGRTLQRDEDYRIDYAAGTLHFSQPLRQASMAQVTYEVDARTAQRNPQTVQLPLDMELLNAARGRLALTGTYRAALDQPGRETTLLGLTGELLPAGNTRLSATFLSEVGSRQTTPERSGVRLQATSRTDRAEWQLTYLSVGSGFSAAQAWQVRPDTDAFSTSLRLLLSERMNISLGFQRAEVGAVRTEGTTATLNYQIAQGIRAVVSYQEQETPLATTATTTTALSVQQGNIAAGVERRTQQQETLLQGRSEVTTDRLNVQVQVSPRTQAQAVVEQQRQETRQGSTERLTTSLGVTSSPTTNLQVRTGIRYDEIAQRQQTELTLGVEARPLSGYRVQGSYMHREGELGDPASAASLRLAAAPRSNLQLEGGATIQTQGDQLSLQRDVLIALQPGAGIRVETGIQSLYARERESYVRTVRAQVTPSSTWRLDVTHRLRLNDSPYAETWGVALSVTPSRNVSVTGSYTRNPEDNRGNIKPQEQAEMRLQAQMGNWTLQGGMGVQRDLLSNASVSLADMSLIYRPSPLMELLTGYRLNRQQTTSEVTAHTYRLGYRYLLGDAFSLSLEGTLTTYQRDHVFVPQQTEYEARVRLGVKF